MSNNEIDIIRKINKTIVHDDGSVDSFERQLLYLSGGIFDTTKPLVVSGNSLAIDYFETEVHKPIIMRVNTAIKIREKHEIGYAFVGQCLDMLKNSVLAFESLTHPSSKIVLLDTFNDEGDPYIAVCRMDKFVHTIEVNEITSLYDKQNFEKFLIRTYDADKKFYKNKKTEQYIKSQRLQLPRGLIYALSDNYYKSSFTKSQVEDDIKKSSKNENLEEDKSGKTSGTESGIGVLDDLIQNAAGQFGEGEGKVHGEKRTGIQR